jgi:hypothetical protein
MKLKSKSVVLAVAIGIGVVGGTAWAAQTIASIVGADGTIHGCYAQKNGALRVVAEGTACTPPELPIQWNQRGDRGAPGPKGDAGPTGPKGDAGPPGPAVASLAGIPCDTGNIEKPDGRTEVAVAETGLLTLTCRSESANPVLTVALMAGPERCTVVFRIPVCTNVRFSVREVDATGTPVVNGFTCLDPRVRSTFAITCQTQRFAKGTTVHLEPVDAPSGFVPSWTGCDSISSVGVCTFVLSDARTVAVTPIAG